MDEIPRLFLHNKLALTKTFALVGKMTTIAFSVTPFKIDQNKTQNGSIDNVRPFGIWEMKRGKYTKTPAKIQVRGIFRISDIRRNV